MISIVPFMMLRDIKVSQNLFILSLIIILPYFDFNNRIMSYFTFPSTTLPTTTYHYLMLPTLPLPCNQC